MTNTPLNPPEAPQPENASPAAQPQGVASAPSRTAAVTAITIVTAVVGGAALLGTGATAAWGASAQLGARDVDQTTSLDAAGVTELDIEAAAAEFELRFADVSEATLEITGSARGDWTMRRDGDELIVRHPQPMFGWWFGSWSNSDQVVTLTLPETLSNGDLDADLSLSAGSLRAEGDFDDLEVDVSAGNMRVDATASSLTAQVSAGNADLKVGAVDEADLRVSAGKLVAELTGAAPTDVSVDASAGQLILTLPDAEYAVTQEVEVGGLDNGLRVNSSSRHEVTVSVSAGSVKLRSNK